ncbi:conserved hypothetical protein [Cellulomonas fimi ATCC 484]|uniref:Coenzyme F420 biosynthesis-associated protein n=2 Tax=Cellulomonas fimi TaxID=1708 RepID=F4GY28_CELFA|nr:conserved hypothetical protein [Cellulomonas fimi ATCC 484]
MAAVYRDVMDDTAPVDWPAAARVAGRLSRPGPAASRAELDDLVAGLRDAAHRAGGHASRITGLAAVDGAAPEDVSRVLVVDRPRWALANTEMFARLAAPLGRRPDGTPTPLPPGARTVGAAQVGSVLALLSGKVLGQFDPFTAAPGEPGRLLLVAPNVLHLERTLGVDAADFRLWVALHEQTHALQFAAAPWLADVIRTRSAELLADVAATVPGVDGTRDPDAPGALDLLGRVAKALLGPEGGGGVLDVLTERQRAVFEEVGAVMALLEGHADVSMDQVGPRVVPTVRTIRRAFEARRDEGAAARGFERVLRRLLGLDAKLAQYRDGAAFVRAVQGTVGRDGFNAVWSGPDALPSPAEIADPATWVRRVHG